MWLNRIIKIVIVALEYIIGLPGLKLIELYNHNIKGIIMNMFYISV